MISIPNLEKNKVEISYVINLYDPSPPGDGYKKLEKVLRRQAKEDYLMKKRMGNSFYLVIEL